MTPFRQRPGFTLIEVLVAAFVLSSIAAGLLATTWRMVEFAHDQVDHMAADAYCHDLLWAVYSQKYDQISSIARFRIDPERELPRIETEDIFGQRSLIVPMLRRYRKELAASGYGVLTGKPVPECQVTVTENAAVTNKTIEVTVFWGLDTGEERRSHSLKVVRAKVERKDS